MQNLGHYICNCGSVNSARIIWMHSHVFVYKPFNKVMNWPDSTLSPELRIWTPGCWCSVTATLPPQYSNVQYNCFYACSFDSVIRSWEKENILCINFKFLFIRANCYNNNNFFLKKVNQNTETINANILTGVLNIHRFKRILHELITLIQHNSV